VKLRRPTIWISALGLVCASCESKPELALVGESSAQEYVLAQRTDSSFPWRIRAFSLADGASWIDGHEVVLVGLKAASDLPLRTWLTLEDLGRASCELLRPASVHRLVENASGLEWEETELSVELRGIFAALVRPECNRCVPFDAEDISVGSSDLRRGLRSAAVLRSGNALASTPDGLLWLMAPSRPPRRVAGCEGTQGWVLSPHAREDGLFGAQGASLRELEIDEDDGSCRSTEVYVARGRIAHTSVTPADWPLQWLVTSVSGTDETEVAVVLYDGARTSTIAEFQAAISVSQSGVRKIRGQQQAVFQAPDEIVISTGYEDVLHHRLDQLEAFRLVTERPIEGLSAVEGWGAVASVSGLTGRRAEVFTFEAETGLPRRLTELPHFFAAAAPFRGGWLAVGRGGSLYEHHQELGDCPVQLELLQGNHVASVLLALPGETYLTDVVRSGDAQAAWLRPRAVSAPDSQLFSSGL
jgi:hypothetical protein